MTTADFKDVYKMPGYKIETSLRDRYHVGFTRSGGDDEVTHAIVHCTGGGRSTEACIDWMYRGGYLGKDENGVKRYRRQSYYRGVALVHYFIDLDGGIAETINPHNYIYASSTGGFDRQCINIELVNPGRNNGVPCTEAQYRGLAILYYFLRERFKNMFYIVGHGRIKNDRGGDYKVCPGAGFSWDYFHMELGKLKIPNVLGNEAIEVV